MTAKKSVLSFMFCALCIGLGIVGYTLWQDPYCGSCKSIDLDRYSVNSYYQAAQVIKANPDAEVVIVGSSRGQAISPEWLSEKLGKKVINLSVAGSSAESKIAFIELAKEMTHLKEIIWLADYFEILGESKDKKLESMEIYRRGDSSSFENILAKISFGIDHNNFEAAISGRTKTFTPKQGWGDVSNDCFQSTYSGKTPLELLDKEIDLLYFNYKTGVFSAPESTWKKELISSFLHKQSKLKVKIVIMPYHPRFWSQLRVERPQLVENQIKWSQAFREYPVEVYDFLEGIPGDDGSNKYWDDGVHLTCYGSFKLFETILQDK